MIPALIFNAGIRGTLCELGLLPAVSLPKIVLSEHATEWKQFRFPRTKKRRIRNKWAKRPENFRSIPRAYSTPGGFIVHPSIANELLPKSLPSHQTPGRPFFSL